MSAVLAALVAGSQPPAIFAERVPADCRIDETVLPLDAVEQALLAAINRYRANLGAPVLEVSPTLTRAAVWKSAARAAGAAETHDDPFRRWHERLFDCGYRLNTEEGENLAKIVGVIPAEQEAAQVLAAWQASPSHDRVLRDPAFRAIGLARRQEGTAVYWTATFGGMHDTAGVAAEIGEDDPVPAGEDSSWGAGR